MASGKGHRVIGGDSARGAEPSSETRHGVGDPLDRSYLAYFLGTAPTVANALRPLPYLASAGAVGLALACGLAIERFVGLQSVLLAFLMAIIVSAIAWGLFPSLLACVLSVLTYNFFFLAPLYTLTIADPDNAVALIFFFLVAVMVSNLTAATRSQAVIARARAKTTAALYAFSGKLAGTATLDDVIWASAYQISSMLDVHTILLMPAKQGGALAVVGGYPPDDRLEDHEMEAAQWSWQHGKAAGLGTDVASNCPRHFLPLRTGSGAVGMIGVYRDTPGPFLTGDERRLLDALADQAAVAIERVTLAGVLAEARLLAETERLRSAMLTSISHDLRTPLASIIGVVSSLRSLSGKYGPEQQEELLAMVQDEAERLNRFVTNLLDITRLESGAIELRAERFDLSEIIGTALRRAAALLDGYHVAVDIAADLPMLRLDALLFEQVLFNLLDNAAKYAPPSGLIQLAARCEDETVIIELRDEGPGIEDAQLERVFDKFYRVQAQDHRRAGTGLGLAICRGFIEAQGGRIEAGNRRDRSGAVFTIRMPAGGDPGETDDPVETRGTRIRDTIEIRG
jgi:two-component system sensor histidine kinase KdpD